MPHIKIHAEHEGRTQIDIIGQIGDSFWEEGNTLESVKSDLQGVNTPVDVNLASLGGDAFDGLAIHDLLSAHKHDVNINVIGATASAGAVIASAATAGQLNISENSLFLIHKSLTFAFGNAKDLEKQIDVMNKVDDRMTKIFSKRSGKDEDEVSALMDEDKFLSADEAKEFGLVDEITTTEHEIAASAGVDMEKVFASKLPEWMKDQLKAKYGEQETPEAPKEDSKGLMSMLKALSSKVDTLINGEPDAEGETKEIKILDNEEVSAMISDLEARITEVKEAEKAHEDVQAEVQTLKDKINRLETKGTSTDDANDPELDDNGEVDPFKAVASQVTSNLPKITKPIKK